MAANFSIILVIATLITGLIALLDKLVWEKKRLAKIDEVRKGTVVEMDDAVLAQVAPEPSWIETSKSVFPVIAIVLVLRSFVYEPFQIPSGSMKPTLLIGDFVLVEKFAYGLKDPAFRFKFLPTGEPERGDIVVFKYPVDTRLDYIKRVIGLPGDKIQYINKQLYIQPKCIDASNCPAREKVKMEYLRRDGNNDFSDQFGHQLNKFREQLGEVSHNILIHPAKDNFRGYQFRPNPAKPEWIVPEGHYFVMGDNRDNSEDGRFWGFVSDDNLVGKAVAIWMSFEFDRNPESLLPQWVPTGVRFNRIGGIH